MAKKNIETKKSSKTKVKALISLTILGYAYFEGAEFEIESTLANEWIKDGYVEKCGK